MKSFRQEPGPKPEPAEDTVSLVLPLSALDRSMLPEVGGKAANLGELIRAGFSVPAGFCVTTAAYARVSSRAGLDTYLSGLEAVSREESARQIELATAIRTVLCQTPLLPEVIEAVTSAYQVLSSGEPIPVSVRSSATAEDLPEASFAGQQETFLNVIGSEAVLAAVQRCFASLWTDRATQYRTSLGIAPRNVRLAVVVQRMVEAEVAGVLFTANPLTGKRRQTIIDANPGLGEAVVSGATNPDHFVVQTTTGEIVERRLGDKQVLIQAAAGGGIQKIEAGASPTSACLSDEQIRASKRSMRPPRTSSGPSILPARCSCSRHDRLRPCFPSRLRLHPLMRVSASTWPLASSKAPIAPSRPWAFLHSDSSRPGF